MQAEPQEALSPKSAHEGQDKAPPAAAPEAALTGLLLECDKFPPDTSGVLGQQEASSLQSRLQWGFSGGILQPVCFSDSQAVFTPACAFRPAINSCQSHWGGGRG